MQYEIVFSPKGKRQYEIAVQNGFGQKVNNIITSLMSNPYNPPCEKLTKDLKGAFSKKINSKHRIVYTIEKKNKVVEIIRCWDHYDD